MAPGAGLVNTGANNHYIWWVTSPKHVIWTGHILD